MGLMVNKYQWLVMGDDGIVIIYHLVMTNITMERSTIFKNGKPSINGPCSMAMLNNQMV